MKKYQLKQANRISDPKLARIKIKNEARLLNDMQKMHNKTQRLVYEKKVKT